MKYVKEERAEDAGWLYARRAALIPLQAGNVQDTMSAPTQHHYRAQAVAVEEAAAQLDAALAELQQAVLNHAS